MNHPIQQKLIDLFLEPLSKPLVKISDRGRHFIFILGGCLLFLQSFLHNSGVLEVRYLYEYIVGCIGLGLMILMLLKPGLSPIDFDYKVMIPWIGLGVMMFMSGVFHAYDYFPDALLILIAYPIFFLVSGNHSINRVFSWLHQIADISFVFFFLVSMLLFPMEGNYYSGLFINPNGLAFYLTIPYCCALASLLNPQKSWLHYCKDILISGLSFAFMYLSTSRTGIVSLAGTTVVVFVLAGIIYKKEIFSILWKRLMPVAVVVYLAIPGLVIMNESLACFWVPTAPPTIEIPIEVPEQAPTEKPEQEPTEKPEQEPTEEAPSFMEKVENRAETKFQLNRSINSITSGRWYIWKGFLGELNLTGHSPDYRFTYYLGQEYEHIGEKGMVESGTAHMTILQYAYSNGIIAGVCFLLLNLIAGIKSIWLALKQGKSSYGFFPVAMAAAFVLTSLFASCCSPFIYLITFYYFSSLSTLVSKGKKIEQNN